MALRVVLVLMARLLGATRIEATSLRSLKFRVMALDRMLLLQPPYVYIQLFDYPRPDVITLLTRWRLQATLVVPNPLVNLVLQILRNRLPKCLLQVPRTAPPADRQIGQLWPRLQPTDVWVKLWTELLRPHTVTVMFEDGVRKILRLTALLLLFMKWTASSFPFGKWKLAVPHRLLKVRWLMTIGRA